MAELTWISRIFWSLLPLSLLPLSFSFFSTKPKSSTLLWLLLPLDCWRLSSTRSDT